MRYLSFNAIAKRCPKGQWKDEKSGRCVSIEEWKKLNYKYLQENQDKEKTVRCPKGKWKDPKTGECVSQEEWKKRNYKNYQPKEEKVFEPKDKITLDTSGIAKAPILQLTRGFTRKKLEETFQKDMDKGKTVGNELSSFTKEDDINKAIKKAFEGTDVPLSDNFDKIDPLGQEEVMHDMGDVISEYPIGVLGMGGIEYDEYDPEKPQRSLMYFKQRDKTIHFNGRYFRKGGDDGTDTQYVTKYQKAYDPVLKKVSDKWSFHPNGMKVSQSFSHEYGHNLMSMLINARTWVNKYYKENNDEIPEEYTKKIKEHNEKRKEFEKEISDKLDELGAYDSYVKVSSFSGEAGITLYISEHDMEEVDEYEYVFNSNNPIYLKFNEYMEKNGYKREKQKFDTEFQFHTSDKGEVYSVHLNYKDPERKYGVYSEPLPIPPYEKLLEFVKSEKSLFTNAKSTFDSSDIQGEIIANCEEIYKELYKVKEIIPSDVYSGYGYFGSTQEFDSSTTYMKDFHEAKRGRNKGLYVWEDAKKYPINAKSKDFIVQDHIAGERIAEAFNDVTIRKDQANSMSVLIVSAVEYEFYRLATGDSRSFSEFLKDNYDFSKVGQPIIKSSGRYLLFNSIAKRCPNGKRFDDETNTCIPKEEWEAKHHHDYTKKPKQEQPKRKVDIASQSFVKVDKGTPEYKMIKNLKVGNSDEAKASRKAVIDFYNKRGWIPKIDVEPFKVNGTTFDGTKTTYTLFTTEDGKYTPERQEVHKQILKKIMNRLPKPPTDRKPIVLFTGGGSASGKGSMDGVLAEKMGIPINIKPQQKGESDEDYRNRKSRVYDKMLGPYKIDPDAIMELIPEYEEYVKHDMIGGASVFHKEASDIAKMVFDMALAGGYDFIYDGTFSSQKAVKMAKKIDRKKYDTHLVGKLTDVDICKQRSGKRFINGGKDGKFPRIVPNKVLESTNSGFKEIYDSGVDDLFDSVTAIEDSQNKKK